MPVTGHGPASSTVTRSTRPSSRKSCVIPSFLARIAGTAQPASRISMSTPAGRWSRRWSESTVLGGGWWMSMSRLCVRISKCSRESLSLKGDRITQYTFFSVGRGTGPDTVAPVRCAVSTISLAAVSIAEASYAFRRMRILFCAATGAFCPVLEVGFLTGGVTCRRRVAVGCAARLLFVSDERRGRGAGAAPVPQRGLLDDFGDDARADGAAALTDGEAQAGVHGDGLDQLDLHLHVVARHDHLRALGQVGDAGDVRGAEVELGPVPVEERGVAAALLLLEDVHLGLELRVRRDRARLAEHLPALDLLALDASEQAADVVAGLALIEDLAEHLDAGDHRVGGLLVDAHDLHRVTGVDDALLDAAGRDGAAAGDREDVLDRHQERLVEVTLGLGDVRVQLLTEVDDLLDVLLVALERLQRRADDERDVVAREVVLVEQVAHLDLDELQELLVVDHVGLVEEHDDVRHADLAGEQDVLARLGHRAVRRRDHEDRAVHLRGARDHVLHVVGVTGTVDVRVVTVLRLVLDMGGRDRDAARLLLRRVVDLLEGPCLTAPLLRQDLGDRRGQGRLAMVDVTDGADVDMRLVPLELLLRHFLFAPLSLLKVLGQVPWRTRAD